LENSAPSRLHGLDTLRALAIVAVMLYHLAYRMPESLAPIAALGWTGVDLFFVLSGFLIGGQLLKPYLAGEQPSLADFYRRRAFRILPAYFVVLALYFFLPAWREAPLTAPWWQYPSFTWNLFVDFPSHRAFSHVWSLCVEEHFYLILPLLVLGLMRKPSLAKTVTLIAAIVALGIALRAYEFFHVILPDGLDQETDRSGPLFMERIYYPTWTRLDGLLCGVTLALIRIFRPAWWKTAARHGYMLLSLGAITTTAAFRLFRWGYPSLDNPMAILLGFPLLSLGLGFLVAGAVADNSPLRHPIPGANLIATLAFSLYLTHKEIAHLDADYLSRIWNFHPDAQGWNAAALYAATCLVAAALLYVCIERPFLQLRDQLDRSAHRLSLIQTPREALEDELQADPAL
jgi:peptidoglycan/LPS O-acetylase OafA/YrhL